MGFGIRAPDRGDKSYEWWTCGSLMIRLETNDEEDGVWFGAEGGVRVLVTP